MVRFAFACLTLAIVAPAAADVPSEAKLPTADELAAVAPVDLFDAIDDESVSVKVVMKDAGKGNLIVKNLGNDDLNLTVPDTFGVKHILPQFDGGFGGGGGAGGGGGGQAGGGGAAGGAAGGGGGFFSIPAGESTHIPYAGACLEHGKPEPRPKMHYIPVRIDEVTTNADVQEITRAIARNGRFDRSAQAAIWHLENEMSWQELAAKKYDRVGSPDTPYFTPAELAKAQQIAATAKVRAKKRAEEAEANDVRAAASTASPRG